MTSVKKPVILNETGIRIAEALEGKTAGRRVFPLAGSSVETSNVIVAVGVPEYVTDISKYSAFGITETGWYVFARIYAKEGGFASVTGAAGYIGDAGGSFVDVAVRFEVTAASRIVDVDWGTTIERFVFQAPDLGIRNLDYRVTFYVYDAADYVTWHYKLATGSFAAGTNYYVKRDGSYTLAEVTAGEAIPEGYYVQTPAYVLTDDVSFEAGKDYYILQDGEYVKANISVGEPVAADTYYEKTAEYVRTEDEVFVEGTDYYTLQENVYTLAEVTAGEAIPNYYVHSKITIEGLVRNVTYRLDETIDCPMEFILPEIEDEAHGAWFEIRCRHAGAYSMELVPPTPDVKIATEHTQKETAGINMINLHYTEVDGVKIWRFMNTHSGIPA